MVTQLRLKPTPCPKIYTHSHEMPEDATGSTARFFRRTSAATKRSSPQRERGPGSGTAAPRAVGGAWEIRTSGPPHPLPTQGGLPSLSSLTAPSTTCICSSNICEGPSPSRAKKHKAENQEWAWFSKTSKTSGEHGFSKSNGKQCQKAEPYGSSEQEQLTQPGLCVCVSGTAQSHQGRGNKSSTPERRDRLWS